MNPKFLNVIKADIATFENEEQTRQCERYSRMFIWIIVFLRTNV